MSSFTKQLIFISLAIAIILAGALIIKGATPSGKLKIKPSLTAKVKMVNQENTTSTSNNPVGWWKMDEGTAIHGSSVADSSGYGNTGTLSTGDGSLNKSVAAKLGKGLSFDGVNDFVSIPNIVSSYSNLTVSMWVKRVGDSFAGGWSGFYSFYNTTDGYTRMIWQNSTANIIVYVNNTVVYNGTVTGMVSDRWLLFTVVITPNNVFCYMNGNLFKTYSGGFVVSSTLSVAGRGQSNQYYFNGLIDDVRIYNRALSAGEVRQMYNSTKDGYLGKIKVSTGLVGYWKLDDNNALTSVIDYSGKGNTGTAYSSTATSTSVLSTSTAMVGRAMSFDGGDDWVSGGAGSSLNITDAITISAWVKMNTQVNFAGITDKNDKYVLLTITGQRRYYFILRDVDGVSSYAYMTSAIPLGQWAYITATWKKGDYLRIYYNGVQDGISAGVLNKSIADNLAGSLSIGKYSSYFFNGLIDEVKIWNYARSAEQIANDYIIGSKHQSE